MSSSIKGTSSFHTNGMKGVVLGSRPTRSIRNLPIEKNDTMRKVGGPTIYKNFKKECILHDLIY